MEDVDIAARKTVLNLEQLMARVDYKYNREQRCLVCNYQYRRHEDGLPCVADDEKKKIVMVNYGTD
jgi:hypothetical protein